MDKDFAIRILDKSTTSDAVRELKYYSGFNEERTIDAIEEAMQMGADALREQTSKQIEIDESMNELLEACGFEE